MSNEDKMRYDFGEWASDNGAYPKAIERNGDEYKLMQTQQFWEAWKACAAIKDAESEKVRYEQSVQIKEVVTALKSEIAARDLMIKELREVLHNMLEQFTKSHSTLKDSDARVKAHKALANSKHIDGKALEKALLEARIDEISQYEDVSTDAFERLRNLKAKLAELNKE